MRPPTYLSWPSRHVAGRVLCGRVILTSANEPMTHTIEVSGYWIVPTLCQHVIMHASHDVGKKLYYKEGNDYNVNRFAGGCRGKTKN